MKLNKIFLLGLMVSAALLTACSDDDDHDYKRGAVAGAYDVTFISEERFTLEYTAESFDVELYRPDSISQEALTVPIEVVSKPDFITVPSEVTFAAGESVAMLTVTIGEGMEPFEEYSLNIRVPEQFTNPYSIQDGTPSQNIIFLKEDFKTVNKGTYYSQFNNTVDPDIELQWSDIMSSYRLSVSNDEFAHTFTFTVDEEGTISFNEPQIYQGWDYPGYGGVYASAAADKPSLYDDEDKAYYFGFKYAIPAAGASFGGTYYDYFVVEE